MILLLSVFFLTSTSPLPIFTQSNGTFNEVPDSTASNDSSTNETSEQDLTERLIEPYSLFNITLKVNDWRDMHKRHQIIWSLESPNHPEFGKNYPKGLKEGLRMTKSSQLMSFTILGSVIGFILYTYLAHVLMMRRLDREAKAEQLRELVQRSALIMAGSANHNEVDLSAGRRHSLINMFKGFKL